jgi:hypothetical protein
MIERNIKKEAKHTADRKKHNRIMATFISEEDKRYREESRDIIYLDVG